jgi:histidinol dehydrogenase
MGAGTPDTDLVISRYVLHELDDVTRARLLSRAQTDVRALLPRVRAIIDDVRRRGDRALVEYTREFDGVELDQSSLMVGDDEFEQAERMVDAGLRAAITDAVANIRTHHSSQVPETMWTSNTVPGVLTGERFTPLAAVGCMCRGARDRFHP